MPTNDVGNAAVEVESSSANTASNDIDANQSNILPSNSDEGSSSSYMPHSDPSSESQGARPDDDAVTSPVKGKAYDSEEIEMGDDVQQCNDRSIPGFVENGKMHLILLDMHMHL